MPVLSTSTPIYRIDKFVIPDGARSEFLERVQQTHALLRQQAGFVCDLVVEKDAGPAECLNPTRRSAWLSAFSAQIMPLA